VTFAASPRRQAALRHARFGALALVGLFLAHDALFVAQFGPGADMGAALAATGHGSWWTPYVLAVVAVAALLGLGALLRIRTLHVVAATLHRLAPRDPAGFAAEWRALASRLLPVVVVLLLVQENIEHLAADGTPAGLAPIGTPAGILAIVASVLAVAAGGALVRWRIADLEARILAARTARFPRPSAAALPSRAGLDAAGVCHRWLLARDDPGRAPPRLAA
jgi:hypothetical protein